MPAPSRLTGRRQVTALAMVVAIHLGRGIRILLDTAPTYPEAAVLHDMLPTLWHGVLWIAIAVVLTALMLTGLRRAAWTLAMALPCATAISFLWSLVMWVAPGPPPGSAAAIGQIITWCAITGWIYVTAGWPETDVERVA